MLLHLLPQLRNVLYQTYNIFNLELHLTNHKVQFALTIEDPLGYNSIVMVLQLLWLISRMPFLA